MSYSFVSVYWSQDEQKPTTSNIAINNSGEFDKVVYSLSKIKSLNNYNIYNTDWVNNNKATITNSNVTIGSNNTNGSLTAIGNFLIEGNINSIINSNLGSDTNKWNHLYGNSIYIDNIAIKTSNNSITIPTFSVSNLELNSLIFKLSNNQLLFQNNGIDIKTIDFENYQMIVYSNNFYNTSNFLINDLLYKLNNLFTTDTIPLGIYNQFITNGTINSNTTFMKNLNVNQSYNLKGINIPFSFYSNTNIIASNASLNFITGTNFGYYSFLTNGSISFPQATNCDILVIGAGGNGGNGRFSGGGGSGEVISYTSYPFSAASYNIQIGQTSFNSNLRLSQIILNGSSIIKALGGGNGGDLSNNPEIGGSGGGGYSNFSVGALAGVKWNASYSYVFNGSNGTSNIGGNGGNSSYVSSIIGINQTFAIGGIGATSNSIPSLKTTYGTGGDGNGGLGTSGIIIIKVPLNIQRIKFDGHISYSNIDNRPEINDLMATNNYLTIGNFNQINFPLGNVSWNNEWFLYIGKSPSSVQNSFIFWHSTSNINSKWWFNGTQTSNSEIYQNSDIRIKKEVCEISNPLDKLMALKPKEYYLCDDKDYLKKYGIIAQDVANNQELGHLVYNDIDYIANIYTRGIYLSDGKIIQCNNPIINKIEIGDELKILLDNPNASEIIIDDLSYHNRYKKRFVKVMRFIDDYSFAIFEDIELSNEEKNNLFIYGKKVNDFKKLDYSSIYSLNIRCTQELLLKTRNNGKKLEELEQRLNKR